MSNDNPAQVSRKRALVVIRVFPVQTDEHFIHEDTRAQTGENFKKE